MKRLRDITHNLLSATEKYRDEGEDYPVSVSTADIDRLLEHIGRDFAEQRVGITPSGRRALTKARTA